MSTPAVTPQDFQYIKLPDGSYGKFRGDASDQDIRTAISQDFPKAFRPDFAANPPGVPRPQAPQMSQVDITGKPINPLAGMAGVPGGSPNPQPASDAYVKTVGAPIGAAAAYMGGANALPYALPFVRTGLRMAPYTLGGAALSAGYKYARENLPGGHYLPSSGEWLLPMLMMGQMPGHSQKSPRSAGEPPMRKLDVPEYAGEDYGPMETEPQAKPESFSWNVPWQKKPAAPVESTVPATEPVAARPRPGEEPDIDTEMRLGVPNPPAPRKPPRVGSGYTPEQENAIVERMTTGRAVSKQKLEANQPPAIPGGPTAAEQPQNPGVNPRPQPQGYAQAPGTPEGQPAQRLPYFYEKVLRPQGAPTGQADIQEDQAIVDQMRENLAAQERKGTAEVQQEFAARNSMDVPKRVRQQRASQITGQQPPSQDLTEILKQSVEMAKRRKKP